MSVVGEGELAPFGVTSIRCRSIDIGTGDILAAVGKGGDRARTFGKEGYLVLSGGGDVTGESTLATSGLDARRYGAGHGLAGSGAFVGCASRSVLGDGGRALIGPVRRIRLKARVDEEVGRGGVDGQDIIASGVLYLENIGCSCTPHGETAVWRSSTNTYIACIRNLQTDVVDPVIQAGTSEANICGGRNRSVAAYGCNSTLEGIGGTTCAAIDNDFTTNHGASPGSTGASYGVCTASGTD